MHARILSILSALILSGCILGDKTAGRGTVVDNELRTGYLYLADGRPAYDARVRVYPVGYVPDSTALPKAAAAVFSTRTDAKGRYRIDSLPAGEYNITGEGDSLYSFQDSVYLSPRIDSIPADTLDAGGSLAGVVALQPQDDPQSVVVQALGTNSYAIADGSGRFRLMNLGKGRYTLRVVTTFTDYTPLIVSARVQSGKETVFPDTLRPAFTGVPVVRGLRATYDTLAGVVTLAWNPVAYRAFDSYQIFRDRAPGLALSTIAIDATIDTVFRDTLRATGGVSPFHSWEYRVRVKNVVDKLGPAFGKVVIDAVDPQVLRTRITLAVARSQWDSAAQAESYLVTAGLSNGGRGIRSLRWSVGVPDGAVSSHSLGGTRETADSLRFQWGKEGPFSVQAIAIDDGGHADSSILEIPGNARPLLSGTAPASIQAYREYAFAPIASDPDSDRLVFTAKNLPAWLHVDASTGRLSGTPVNADTGNYPGILLAVSDGRRGVSLPPFSIQVQPSPFMSRARAPAAQFGAAAVTVASKVYLIGGSPKAVWGMPQAAEYYPDEQAVQDCPVNIYDIATDSWKAGKTLGDRLPNVSAHVVAGKIVVLGHRGSGTQNVVYLYDPAADSWEKAKEPPFFKSLGVTAAVGGKIYLLAGYDGGLGTSMRTWEYDVATDSWTQKADMPYPNFDWDNQATAAAIGGKVYLTGFTGYRETKAYPHLIIYDPATDTFTEGAGQPRPRVGVSACAVDGKLYVAGGATGSSGYITGSSVDWLDVYDPTSDSWSSKPGLIHSRIRPSLAGWNGGLFVFQGYEEDEFGHVVETIAEGP